MLYLFRHLNPFHIIIFGIITAISSESISVSAAVIARVNNHDITLEELNKKYLEAQNYPQYQATTKHALLEELIKRQLGIQEAKKLSLDKDPIAISRMNTVLYQVLIEKKLNGEFEKIHVSDDEAKDFYKQYPEIRTSHIFVGVRPGASREDDAAAKQKLLAIQNTHLKEEQKSFAEVAQKYSEGPSARNAGDLGYQTRDQQPDPTYYDAALQLGSPGKISGPIRTRFGYHLIELTAIRPWDKTDQALVKQKVFEMKRVKIFEDYMASLRKQASIKIHTELLKD